MKILVVCGAGASSTFVAHRIRRSAGVRGLEVTVQPTSESSLGELLAEADVVLLGAHLATRREEVDAAASRLGVAVALLPESAFTAATGDEALDLALAAAHSLKSHDGGTHDD